ncbi:mucin-5AC-like isoform X3 [Leptopilina boulardi]|uniref:mucin-5AC-like isoform X3 n=1 Tax=Leptopilina boulardi TaxID=63433 RepID=UPI0021F62C39|nr:mucin-5AC-like isoform X3 [Leptopilina boulardi]
MELRFSRCSVALLLLLFVAVNALRGPGVPVDEPKLPAPRSRGSSRFNAQSARTTESPPDSIPIQKSLNRRGSSNRKTNGFNSSPIEEGTTLKTTKIELNSNNRKFEPKKSINKNQSTTSSTNDEISTTNRKVIFNKKNSNQRHLIDNNSPEVGKFQKVSTRSRQLNRNIQSDQAEKIVLDKNGPSIFSATNNSDDSRLRTGRKIQTTFTQRELRSEIPASKRFASRRSDDDDLNSEKIEKKIDSVNNLRKIIDHSKRDSLPAGSENINVPAILQVTRRSAPSTQSTITEEIDSRKSRQRGRTSFAESVRSEESSRSDSRRVPSRSDQIGNDEIVNRRNGNRFSKDEVDTIKMRSSEMKSRIGDSDLRSRGRGQDASSIIQDGRTMGTSNERRNGRSRNQEDSRKRSRNRSRIEQSKSSESTTSQETVTAFPEVTASGGRTDFDSGSLIISSRSATTVSPNSRIVSTTTSRATRRESEGTTSTRSRERTGTSRRKASKEDFYNHGLGFRGRRPLPDSSTVGTIITTEIPQRIVTTTIIPQESQARGNPGWSLHRRPYTGAESSLVTTEEEITTTSGSATKSPGRRGNKTFVKAPGDSPIISANHENIDDENYPPDFKEKLAQLKNLGSSSGAKATTRSPLQGNKKASTSLFSARSRMKLENARKLVKPELLDEETNLQTDSINERKNLDIEEEKKLENKLSDLHTESTLGQESVVKPKLARPKKNDETNKIHNFTPKSRISSVKEDGKNKSQNSTRNSDSFSKSRSTFKIRSKPKVENRIEANNSLGRGKSFTRRTNKTNDYSTTQKPKSTSIRRSLKNTEENKLKSSTSSRKPISRYRNASTGKSGSKYKFSRTSTTNQINSNSIGEITENPVTMKNYISVTRSLSTTISEEISTKKLRTKLFNDLSRSSVDETRLLKTKKEPTKINETTTTPTTTLATKNVRPTSRYSRNKVQVFKTDSILKSNVTNSDQSEKKIVNSTQKIDPRSRTATYRRHSEVAQSLLRSSTVEPNSIEITPKATRFQVSTSNPSPQLVTQEPVVNVKVSNDSNSVQQQSLQILQDGNTFTGNSGNIFNPTKNVLVTAGNVTLLEQIRGTVAPLLGSLGARSPIFSGIYNNASNINTAVRITPNGSPPRFSARYKGAELFVRNPSISQSAIPTITSSTTPFTPIENSGLPPPIEVSSNGEPKVLTFYQALESASITDEQLKTNLQQLGRVAQVDRLTDNDPNGTNSSNNDIEPITVAVTTTKSTFITPKEILPSDAIPPTPEATQTPDRTPTTSENPTTFEMISTSELNPPLADVSTFLDVNNRIQAATTTISTTSTEAEDATSFSNIPNFSNNDIGDLEFSRNVAINTDSSNLEATTIGASQENVRTTEATSTTEMNVFIVTPVKPEDTTDSGFETTTELISKSSFESTRSILDSTSEIVPNSTPEFIPNFTPEFSTESSSKVSSLNDEALYATSNFRATTDEETFQKLTNFDGKNEFLGSASTVNPARTSVLNRGYFSTEIPVFTDGFLSTTDRVVDINNRGNFFENYASTEVPFSLTETPSTEISRQLPTTATETQLSGMSSTEMPSTIAISSTTEVPSTTTVSSTTTVQSTTLSSTTEFPTTTETSTTEMPTTTTSTELPTTTMSSAGRVMTSSTTKRTLTTPKIIPSTLIPMGGFPRLPKLQSFLDTLAQLGNPTIKSQDSSSATAQTTARPNFISSNLLDFPSSSRNPTTPSTRLLPTSFGVNFPTTTTRLLPTGTYSPPLSNFGTSLPPLNNFGTTPPPLNNFGTTPSPLNNFGTTPSPLNNFGTTPPVNNFRTTFPPLNNFETTLPSLNNVETTSSPLNNVGTTSPPLSNIGTTPPAATTIPPPNNIGTTLLPMNNDGSNFPTSTSSPSTTAASSSKLLSNDATRVMNPAAGSTPTMTTPYMGRFGGSRLTPAPRFSSSSSTTAPLRDYLIYGIYPNKTIVRKRPEDNLIDARNIDSPYVIFGIYPDGRLVRKFPNGTVIPDPPSNPVEVVFSLSTSTTTNRPSLPVFTDNQANQGFRNQNAALSNPVATLEKQISLVGTNDVDNGLSGNAIGPIGTTTSPVPPSVSTTQKMVINAPNATSSVPSATSSSSSNSNVVAGSNGSQQGGRIIQDRERDEATRTREAGGQRNSMYIGQDKYINYWINDQPNSNPQVLNVKINSVSTASSQGTGNSPPKLPSFHLSPNSGSGTITVAPNFAWKDPLDQIFGITTNSPPISASVASNILDDVNAQIFASKSSGISSTTSTTSSTLAPTTTTTVATNPTTTFVPFTTTSTTNLKLVNTPDGLFTTNIPKENPFGTTYDDLAFLNTLLNTQRFGRTTPKTLTEVEKLLADKILSLALGKAGPTRSPKAIQPSNASPNLLIETDPNPESGPVVIDLYPSSTTEKSNTATWKPITSTSPVIVNPWKTLLNGIAANQIHISTPNSVSGVSSSLRSLYEQQTTVSSIPRTTTVTTTTSTTPRTTTTTTPKTTTTTTTTTPRTTTTTTPKTTTTEKITTTQRTTTTVRTSTTTPLRTSTTPAGIPTRQLEITSRPSRPRTTTTAPRLGFGANLLRTLFGGNFFGIPTTPTPVRNKRPVRPLTTVIPITSTQIIEQIPKGPFSNLDAIHLIPDVTKKNPNLEAASSSAVDSKLTQSTTFSPEEDAKFLLALLNAAQTMGSSTLSPMGQVSKDDEAFLRAILNGQPSIQPPSLKGENVKSDAALLAALLKAEGIEPSTPANQLREQLLVAGLDKNRDARSSTTSTTTTTTVRTTTRPRPAAPTWKPSSTYPPPLFGGFNFAGSSDSFKGDSNENVRSQVVNAAIGVTRAFSQFLGGAIMGAAKQLQSFVGNGTRSFFS